MYMMNNDQYECDICGFRGKWDAHDDRRGNLWECERCGKHFCTNCFKKACGEEDFRKMLSETDNVFCPECWNSQTNQKEFRINIREELETQVTVEAENKEDALREVEKRWKNGEYILDADNFQGVDFWEDATGNEFGELRRAWLDGRVVILPAKTVYELTWDAGPDCDLICPVSVDGEGCCSFCGKGELCVYERKCRQEHIEQLGKTVFLTREEAERAKAEEE